MQLPISLIMLYVLIALFVAAVVVGFMREIPTARRYLRVRRM